jgi:hypothetical protein
LLIRREVFEEIGGFDEAYWNGHEDVDLCLAAGYAGWDILYEPASVLVHHESVSGAQRFAKTTQNVNRLQEKWRDKVIGECFVVKGMQTERTSARVLYVNEDGSVRDAA